MTMPAGMALGDDEKLHTCSKKNREVYAKF